MVNCFGGCAVGYRVPDLDNSVAAFGRLFVVFSTALPRRGDSDPGAVNFGDAGVWCGEFDDSEAKGTEECHEHSGDTKHGRT